MWKEQAAEQQLEERKGPFDVLTMHLSKVSGVKLLVHHISVKMTEAAQPSLCTASEWIRSRRLTLWETLSICLASKMKVLFCCVLYLFPQIASHTDSFRNSNCWIQKSASLFPSLQDCLGGFLPLQGMMCKQLATKSLPQCHVRTGLRA